MTRPALFFDRDGVLNRNVHYADSGEWESPRSFDDLAVFDDVPESLARLAAADWLLILVSNQPSHAKGKTSLENLQAVHAALEAVLKSKGVSLDAAYYCHHHPEGTVATYAGPCPCRKPSPHFLNKAAVAFDLDLAHCWIVGDRDTDIACGRAAGVRTIKVPGDDPTPRPETTQPDFRAADLAGAADIILGITG